MCLVTLTTGGVRASFCLTLKVNRQDHCFGLPGAVLGILSFVDSPSVVHGPLSLSLLEVIL